MQSTLTKDGFCYEKCDFNSESEYTLHAGRNKAYYYGTHRTLIENNGEYKTLWDLQFEAESWEISVKGGEFGE